MSAIQWKNFSFQYYGATEKAVKDICLTIEPGQFVAVMGASGAGKSTLILTLNGLIPHFQRGERTGSVAVFGKEVKQAKVNEMAQTVGLVFQDFESQLFSTNVLLEAAFGPENCGLAWDEIDRRIHKWLRNVGLESFGERDPSTLSGGQKQRLAIASVLTLEPKILCLDEPTTDLDPVGKDQIFRIARSLKSETDMTVLIAEHETEKVLSADRVIILKQGRVVMDGPPSKILSQSKALRSLGIAPLSGVEILQHLNAPVPEQLSEDRLIAALDEVAPPISDSHYQQLLEEDASFARSLGDPLIQVFDLTHCYNGNHLALDRISLDIQQGDFVAVLGQNGSGKTTLVKHFNGLLTPTSGTVMFKGKSTKEIGIYELGKSIGFVFQNPDHQIFAETVFDEVAFSCRMQKLPKQETIKRVAEALQAVDLEGYEDRDPFSLTKGERQRVAVASVLAIKPEVLIFDEPTTGLDYRQQHSMMQLIQKLNRAGHTIIMVTHQMDIVAEYAKRVIVMNDGRVLLDGRTRDVFQQEHMLKKAHLNVPFVTRWSNRRKKTLLSVAEARRVLQKRGESRESV